MYIFKYFLLQLESLMLGWLGDGPNAVLITNVALVVLTILIYWLIYFLVFRIFRKLSLRVLKSDAPEDQFGASRQHSRYISRREC